MSPLVVVKGDPVDGTDTHNVAGTDDSGQSALYTGTGDYTYGGAVTDGLSDFVTVAGSPLAVVTSSSRLRADAEADHVPSAGSNFKPVSPGPNKDSLLFAPPTGIGVGNPSDGAGSSLLTVKGAKALLDGDAF